MTAQIDPEGTEVKIMHRFADFRRKRVLEVGCGDGRLTWRYAREARRVAGIDLHEGELRVAMLDRPADLEHTVGFAHADAVHLPFPSAAFDLAVFSWSF